jgi:hypothetical protein
MRRLQHMSGVFPCCIPVTLEKDPAEHGLQTEELVALPLSENWAVLISCIFRNQKLWIIHACMCMPTQQTLSQRCSARRGRVSNPGDLYDEHKKHTNQLHHNLLDSHEHRNSRASANNKLASLHFRTGGKKALALSPLH